MVVARNYNEKKYVYYLLNKRETGFHFIIVPTNFTRNFVNFSLFVYKRICGYITLHAGAARAPTHVASLNVGSLSRCWHAANFNTNCYALTYVLGHFSLDS